MPSRSDWCGGQVDAERIGRSPESSNPKCRASSWKERTAVPPASALSDYEQRVAKERAAYGDCLNVHDLPRIALYWHQAHLLTKLRHFGISQPGEILHNELLKRCRTHPGMNHVVSIGSGNGDLEVQLAVSLRTAGYANFRIECLDLNPDMQARAAISAKDHQVSAHIHPETCDFNTWHPKREYDIVIASQSLHHVLQLEHLLNAVKGSLKMDGAFLVSDMIGRNGHMRWPEALAHVREFWRELPASYRYNQQLRRYEDQFEDWDCSREGFEGIRSQDLLPLLLRCFHFEMFLAFGNIIDPFVDRSFGHHFSPDSEWDRQFIDRVHQRDEQKLREGSIKPTHLVAIMRQQPTAEMRFLAPMTPQFAVRRT